MPRKSGCSDIRCITICLLCNATIVITRFYCTVVGESGRITGPLGKQPVSTLLIGLLYVWKKGALEWD